MEKSLFILSTFSLWLISSCTLLGGYKSQYPDVEVDANTLYASVKALTEITPARCHTNNESLGIAANYIKNCFKTYGYGPIEQKYTASGKEYKNVIATYGPNDAPRIIVGAHYDVYGEQPGADDNASAVAGLIELSRLFYANKPDIDVRVDFVAYTLEEPPFFGTEEMGSYIHAKSLNDTNAKVIGMICLEMIGYYSNTPKSQKYPFPLMNLIYPSQGNFIGVVGTMKNSTLIKHVVKNMKKTAIDVESLKAPSFIVGIDFSDHRNYWKFGYNAIMITDTAYNRNPNYHKQTDTIDTLNFEKMQEVIKGVYWSIINIEDSFNIKKNN